MKQPPIHLVLRHDGVLDRRGRTVDASVTQVDLHDLCRLAITFGLAGVHCVTPMPAQQEITRQTIAFWREGYGQRYNPDRKTALDLLHLHEDFETMLSSVPGARPLLLGSSARVHEKNLAFDPLSSIILRSGRPVVLMLGTAGGLSEPHLNRCDWVLPPIMGHDGYNHLSVRCAAAILVDRLSHSCASNHQETAS